MLAIPHGILSAVFYFRSPSFTRDLTRTRKKESFGLQGSCVYKYYNSTDDCFCCLILFDRVTKIYSTPRILEILNLSLF